MSRWTVFDWDTGFFAGCLDQWEDGSLTITWRTTAGPGCDECRPRATVNVDKLPALIDLGIAPLSVLAAYDEARKKTT